MKQRFAPIPVLEDELLKEHRVGGLRITEAWHKACSTIERHAHRWATITLLVDGSFEESYAYRRELACEAPSVHVRPAGEPHRDSMGDIGAHNVVIELDDVRFEQVRRHSSLFDEVRHLQSGELLALSRRIRRELTVDDELTPLALEGLAMEILATASRNSLRSLERPAPWLRRVRDLLHDRFRESGLRLDDLAAESGVHPVHLARAFRSAYGCSPGEYLRQLRVDWAAAELQGSRRSLSDIATAAGFSDQSHFTRVFRKTYGRPPGAWRRSRSG